MNAKHLNACNEATPLINEPQNPAPQALCLPNYAEDIAKSNCGKPGCLHAAIVTCVVALGAATVCSASDYAFVTTAGMTNARQFQTSTLLPTGKVLLAGGWSTGAVTATAELYDWSAGTWAATTSLPTARYYHTATALASGKILLIGGWGASTLITNTALYDPASATWTNSGALSTPRYNHAAVLLPSGKVLAIGGSTGVFSGVLSSVEIYDPSTGTWTNGTSLNTARRFHTATLLQSGKVLVAGGSDIDGEGIADAELYDPGTGVWTNTASMPSARAYHTATLLVNGKVLVAGGSGGEPLSSTVLYDPTIGTWTNTGTIGTLRSFHTATLLPEGKVLIAGGFNGSNTPTAEVYDPTPGTWSGAGSLSAGRENHTATLLPNGSVLIAGGGTASYSPITNAEVYGLSLTDPKSSGVQSFSTVYYASTGTQRIERYQSTNVTTGYAIGRRLDVSAFFNSVDFGTWGFRATNVPINGILKVPTGSGPFPLAIFAHGNHTATNYSDDGYVYLCELLASWGILAATIDANFLNDVSGEVGARAILQLEHIRQFELWQTNAGHPLYGKVDFNNVMIVGHSRGGEAAAIASCFNMLTNVQPHTTNDTSVPLDGSIGLGPYLYNIKSVVGIAPSDASYVPVAGPTEVKDNYLILAGSRDGSVTFFGYHTYDRAQPINLVTNQDAAGFKALLFIHGANHNYFNTSWPAETGNVSATLSSDEQQNVAKVYVSAMAQATLLGKTNYLELLKRHELGNSWLPATTFISQYQDPKRLYVDHYEEDSVATTLSSGLSGTNSWSAVEFTEKYFRDTNYHVNFPDLDQSTHGARLSWSASTNYYQVALSGAGISTGPYAYLNLRVGQSPEAYNQAGADQNFRINVQDVNGASCCFNAAAFSRLPFPDIGKKVNCDTSSCCAYRPTDCIDMPTNQLSSICEPIPGSLYKCNIKKVVMQTLRIPMSVISSQGVVATNISVLKFVFDQVPTGTVYFDDLQLSD